MPCSVSREEQIYYDKESNREIYGRFITTSELRMEVACDALKVLRDLNGLDKINPVTRKWFEIHEERDKTRQKLEQKRLKEEQIAKDAIKKLNKEERRILGLEDE
jgi:hypothetical protein